MCCPPPRSSASAASAVPLELCGDGSMCHPACTAHLAECAVGEPPQLGQQHARATCATLVGVQQGRWRHTAAGGVVLLCFAFVLAGSCLFCCRQSPAALQVVTALCFLIVATVLELRAIRKQRPEQGTGSSVPSSRHNYHNSHPILQHQGSRSHQAAGDPCLAETVGTSPACHWPRVPLLLVRVPAEGLNFDQLSRRFDQLSRRFDQLSLETSACSPWW